MNKWVGEWWGGLLFCVFLLGSFGLWIAECLLSPLLVGLIYISVFVGVSNYF
jgi:hypothetical protein